MNSQRFWQFARRMTPDLGPLRNAGQFRRLYAGQSASFAGSMITFVALPYQVYRLTHSSLLVGLLGLTELAPLVLAGLAGGLLADATDRRRLILTMECGGLLVAIALTVNAASWHRVWLLFLLAALNAGVLGLQRPALDALVPVLVARDDLPAAAALSGLLGNGAQIAGPLLGGGLIAIGGLPFAYATDAATCLIGLIAFAGLTVAPPADDQVRPSLRSLREGLSYARSRPELLGSYLIDMSAMFFGVPYALFPAYAARVGGPAVLGMLYAAPAVGATVVNLSAGWTRQVRRHGRAIVLAVCAWGGAIAAFGLAPGLLWGLVALAAAGGADMVSGIFRMTLWNQTIPARLRGRLAGLEMISYTTGQPLGNVESGLVASLTGSVRFAITSGGFLCIAGAVAVVAALPMLWRYDASVGNGGKDSGEQADPAPAAAPEDEPDTLTA
jgi:Transmembrane secretion effector